MKIEERYRCVIPCLGIGLLAGTILLWGKGFSQHVYFVLIWGLSTMISRFRIAKMHYLGSHENKTGVSGSKSLSYRLNAYFVPFVFALVATWVHFTKSTYCSWAVMGIYFLTSYILILYSRIQASNKELSALLSNAPMMMSSLDYEEVLERIIVSLEGIVLWDTVCIYVHRGKDLVPAIFQGFDDESFKDLKIDPELTVKGIKLFAKDAVMVNHCERAPEFSSLKGYPQDTKTLMALPLIVSHELIGGIIITSLREHAYTDRQLHLTSILSNQAAIAISNAKQYGSTSEMAYTDGLTELFNYRHICNELHRQWKDAQAKKSDLSIVIMDIDRFKDYNDIYGHGVGNIILKNLSNLIKRSVRERDIVGRYGGDEFCIIFPGADAKKTMTIVERIRETVEKTPLCWSPSGEGIFITISAGVCSFPEQVQTDMELVSGADKALIFDAKRQGRNRVVAYEEKGRRSNSFQ